MGKIVGLYAILIAWGAPAFAQKADIQKANSQWIELFNKGDYAGVGMLYTADAVALPFQRQAQSCRNANKVKTDL